MKPKRIEIRFLNISYRTDGSLSSSPEASLKDSFRLGSAGGIPLPEDLDVPEMYGIMKMPVIRLKHAENGFFSDKIIFRVQKNLLLYPKELFEGAE
jgi:hypothetical protein